MKNSDLLQDEKTLFTLRPHLMSFSWSYLNAIFLFVWSVLSYYLLNWNHQRWYHEGFGMHFEYFVEISPYLGIWIGGLLALGIIVSLLTIRWRQFFFYLIFILVSLAVVHFSGIYDIRLIFGCSLAGTVIGIGSTEAVRRSHQFVLTDQRLFLKGGISNKFERVISYDKLTDVSGRQSLIGRLFHYGTLTPITASGFGLGADETAGGAAYSRKSSSGAARIPGVGRLVYLFGGGRSTQTPRARSYYELFGVSPYEEVRRTLMEKVHEYSSGTQSKKELEVQQEILAELRKKESERKSLSSEMESREKELEELRKQEDLAKRRKRREIEEEIDRKEIELDALKTRIAEIEKEKDRKRKELESV